MTPDEIATLARQKWNSTSDTFFSDDELYSVIYAASTELALETQCIRNVYSATTVDSQQEYDKPSLSYSIKRITYDGRKLTKITDREDDSISLDTSTSTSTGVPCYYWEWSDVIELRPIPNDALTLKIYSYDLPDVVSAGSTLSVPLRYHVGMVDYLVAHMATKEKNFQAAGVYQAIWSKRVADAKRYEKKFLRGDSFSHVIDEEASFATIVGAI